MPDEELIDITFPRGSFHSPGVVISYRVKALLVATIGQRRTLRVALNAERILWRIAYELAGSRYGERFHNERLALTPAQLEHWVPAGSRVLDVGCGNGRTLRMLSGWIARGVGIDFDPERIAQAREHGSLPHIEYFVGDARELGTDQFDVVTLVHLIEHVDDPVSLLKSVGELAPTVIVEVPAFGRDVLNYVRAAEGVPFASDDDHVREYSLALACDQLESAGWQVQDCAESATSIALRATRRLAS